MAENCFASFEKERSASRAGSQAESMHSSQPGNKSVHSDQDVFNDNNVVGKKLARQVLVATSFEFMGYSAFELCDGQRIKRR